MRTMMILIDTGDDEIKNGEEDVCDEDYEDGHHDGEAEDDEDEKGAEGDEDVEGGEGDEYDADDKDDEDSEVGDDEYEKDDNAMGVKPMTIIIMSIKVQYAEYRRRRMWL